MGGRLWEWNLVDVGPWICGVCSSSFDSNDASFKQCVLCFEDVDLLHHRETVALEASKIIIETLVS